MEIKFYRLRIKLNRSVIGVCEGRFFELLGDAMGAARKVVLEQTPCALGVAAVLHNVIIVHPRICIEAESFFMHYNATLCNTAWGKDFVALPVNFLLNRKRSRANKNFWSVGKGVTYET